MIRSRCWFVTLTVSSGSSLSMSASFTFCADGIGVELHSVHRPWITPVAYPALSSQFCTPGSLAETTTRSLPSELTSHCAPFRLLWLLYQSVVSKMSLVRINDAYLHSSGVRTV